MRRIGTALRMLLGTRIRGRADDHVGSRARMRRNDWQQAVMIMLIAAVCVASAGVGAGAEWHVYPGAGMPIQDAIDGAGAGDTIYVHAEMYVENVHADNGLALIGGCAAQHIGSPTNHNLDFNTPSDDIHAMISHQHPFYFGNETITKVRTHSNNKIDDRSCLSFDPLAGIEIYNVWMTNLTTWNYTAEAYLFSSEDYLVSTHFDCYVFEDPPDASIVWIDPDGDAYHTTNFYDIRRLPTLA